MIWKNKKIKSIFLLIQSNLIKEMLLLSKVRKKKENHNY